MARRVSRKSKSTLGTAAWFAIGCGGVLVVGLIVLGVIYWMLTSEAPPPPEATASDSDGSAGSAQRRSSPPLTRQLRQAEEAARSSRRVRVTLTVRQDELNALAAQSGSSQVRNLTFFLGDGTIAGVGDVTWRGRTVELTVRARPVVADGTVRMEVREVRVGRLGAPASVQDEVRRELNRGVQRLLGSERVTVESVDVSPGVMTVHGWAGGR